ncbi:MAG: indolepyruvate oxidoreductase subunit beta [Desulfotomaculaceae bacterium]|nr:indolepyruvate oxidoreductase subunit beta [Desulfotomaculaceae bacterium]
MKDPLNLAITGVGGQGNILVSEILAKAASAVGLKVTVGESYGMSQRGGSVSSHIRISRKSLYGPIIPKGCADIIVAFEPVEAARAALELGSPRVKIIVNPRPVYPVDVQMGKYNYPEIGALLNIFKEISAQALIIESTDLALQAGDPVVQNIVMVGALAGSGYLPIANEIFKKVITEVVPQKALRMNLNAYEMGFAKTNGLVNEAKSGVCPITVP